MFSYVLPKRNLTQMLDEVNMKSDQREHQNIQVKRKKKLVSSFAKNSSIVCSGVGEKKGSKNVGEMSRGWKGSLLCFVILLSCQIPSKRINF